MVDTIKKDSLLHFHLKEMKMSTTLKGAQKIAQLSSKINIEKIYLTNSIY